MPGGILRSAGIAAFLTAAGCAHADNAIHGRIELQDIASFAPPDSLDDLIGAGQRNDFLGDARVTWEPTFAAWSLSFHYVLDLDYGDGPRLARLEAGLLPAPPPTWFDLTETFENHAQSLATQRVDRLSIGYTTPDFVLRIGRQVLSWGSGIVFRPMDLFDPFSPTAKDTEYKPGTDMLFAQWLFADGSDLQLIAVPRPERFGAPPTSDSSSFALHYQTTVFNHAVTMLLARDRGDWTAGLGVNGRLGGATWNIEFVPTVERAGPTRVSTLVNISDALTFFNLNSTIFGEYFHNGFGTGSPVSLTTLPADLVDRLARGQLFNLRRDYIAAGMTLELDPLLNVSPTLIADLDDPSVYLLAAGTYSLSDNLVLVAGVQVPVGRRGSEFGGVALAPGSPTVLGPPAQLYTQVRQYF